MADEIASFITPMIDLNPDRRATAQDMLNHDWVKSLEIGNEDDVDMDIEEVTGRTTEVATAEVPATAAPANVTTTRKDREGDEGME